MDISIVIACRNAAATLGETLNSLVSQECGKRWEIVFADNGSTDGSRAIFKACAAAHQEIRMRVVDVSHAIGKAHALNAAIRSCESRWLLFCDADDCVAPGWLAAMARALGQDDFVAAKMDCHTLNAKWCQKGRSTRQEVGLGRIGHEPFCLKAGGATLGFHRRVFDAVGGFDPAFDALEDTDFCIRAHLAGFRLVFVPDAVYLYRFRDSAEGIRRQAYAYARHRALLRQRYAKKVGGAGAAAAWAALLVQLAKLVAWRLKQATLGQSIAGEKLAWFNRQLGVTTGNLSGALLHQVAPPLPKAPPARSAAAKPRQAAGQSQQNA